MRPRYDPVIMRGETIALSATMRQPDGSPVDLSGCSLTVRPSGPTSPISASIDAPSLGRIRIELRGIAVGRYPYEIMLRWPDQQEWMILHGVIAIEEGPYAE